MSMFDILPCPVLITDHTGVVKAVNQSLMVLVDDIKESWIGRSMEHMFALASRMFLQTYVWPMLLRDGEVREIKLQIFDLQKLQQIPVFANCSRQLIDGDDCFTWVFFVSHERSRFEQDLLDARLRAETALEDLSQRERFIRAVTDALPIMISYWDKDLLCRFANKSYARWLGKSGEDVIGIHKSSTLSSELYEVNFPLIQAALLGEPQQFERKISSVDGNVFDCIFNFIPDRDRQNEVRGFFSLKTDISHLREADAATRLYAKVFEAASEGIMVFDGGETILSVNSAFTTITGHNADEVIGKNLSLLYFDSDKEAISKTILTQLPNSGFWKGEFWCKRPNNTDYLQGLTLTSVVSDIGDANFYVGIFSDITEQRDTEQLLKRMAFYDGLTGLPNRVLLMERISHLKAISAREPRQITLIFLDLDGFKNVNDSLGHAMGDYVLKIVAARLQNLMRATDTVARLGGDEFVLLLSNSASPDDLRLVAERIISVVNEPIVIENVVAQVGVSIGIASCDSNIAMLPGVLLKRADEAMYMSKLATKNTYTFAS